MGGPTTDGRARRGYAVCGDPRSGTSYLCGLLRSTGLLGDPREYLARPAVRAALKRNPAMGVAGLLEQASTANGVYAIKLFAYHFDVAGRVPTLGGLPNLAFVSVERRDLLGQAISHVRALQTGQFLSTSPPAAEPRYTRWAIGRELRRLCASQVRWRRYFACNGIEPLRLCYEEIIEDPQAAISAIACHIGLEDCATADLARVDLEVQRDSLSDEWRRRFIGEAGDFDRLGGSLAERIWGRLRQARDRLQA
jgi:LPS sulfotransferase NodH